MYRPAAELAYTAGAGEERHRLRAFVERHPVPVAMLAGSLVVHGGAGHRTSRFRLDDPHLVLTDDAEGEDLLSGWSTDADADALAASGAGEFGASVVRLTAPGTAPLAVLGQVRVIERFRSGGGRAAGDAGLAGRSAGRGCEGFGGRGDPARDLARWSGAGLRVRAARLRRGGPGVLVPSARDGRLAGDGVAPRRW